jgi:NAD(P)-dependent dehydrogenase (short-subunit alcohol dehydrogenase family)
MERTETNAIAWKGNMADLASKVALITGASSGIGKAATKRLAAAGAKVALVARDDDELAGVAEQLEAESMTVVADVSKAGELEAAYQQVAERWGRLDIVFANAGINGVWAPLEELTLDEWRQTLEVNLTGTFLTVKHALPLLKRQGGSVIITSSVNGTRMFSNTGATAYSCSKAAQVAFMQMTALELAPFKIRVNAICPGAIDTNIDENTEERNLEAVRIPVEFPKGRIPLTGDTPGTSAQVAELVYFLASDAASHITGTPIWIDGAQSLLKG